MPLSKCVQESANAYILCIILYDNIYSDKDKFY